MLNIIAYVALALCGIVVTVISVIIAVRETRRHKRLVEELRDE